MNLWKSADEQWEEARDLVRDSDIFKTTEFAITGSYCTIKQIEMCHLILAINLTYFIFYPILM